MKQPLSRILLLLLLPLLLSAAPQSQQVYQELLSPPFTVRYDARDGYLARDIGYLTTGAWQRVERVLPVRLPGKPLIWIAASADEFYRIAQGSVPHWGAAVALGERNIVLLKSKRWASVTGDWSSLLSHELAHLAVHNLSRGFHVPKWLGEGIAVSVSGELDISRRSEIARALMLRRLFALDELERMNSFSRPEAQLAYSQAVLAVDYLRERFGGSSLVLLLNQLGRGHGFDHAFEVATGENFTAFEKQWRRHLWQHYFYYILLGINSWIWGFILLLVIAAIITVRRRNRRTRRRWELEEPHEEESRFDPFDW